MNEFICIGKIVNTHGIKGEIRIKSDFKLKNKVFLKDFNIYIGPNKELLKINTYRVHKDYDMITLNGINNINDVLKYKGNLVYVKRSDILTDNEYVLNDLIGFEVYDNEKLLGKVFDFYENNGNILLEIKGIKTFYIPTNSNYIKNVDLKNKKIDTNNGSDLIL